MAATAVDRPRSFIVRQNREEAKQINRKERFGKYLYVVIMLVGGGGGSRGEKNDAITRVLQRRLFPERTLVESTINQRVRGR